MRVLIWQWSRRGGPPRFAASLAEGSRPLNRVEVLLSLSPNADLMQGEHAPYCALPGPAYTGVAGLIAHVLRAPAWVWWLVRALRELRVDLAVCAQPAPLDLLLLAALKWCRVPVVVIAHDAEPHLGDGLLMRVAMWLQGRLTRRADVVVTLCEDVARRLIERRSVARSPQVLSHPPFVYGAVPEPPRAHGGLVRLLCFGRLLEYKGLDLLAGALQRLAGWRTDWTLRVVGSGPESADLAALRVVPGVTVENRWVPDEEIPALFGWADAVVLPYREASQSGVISIALGVGRPVVVTDVGGLAEQVRGVASIVCRPTAESLAAALCAAVAEPASWVRLAPKHDHRWEAWRALASGILDGAGHLAHV